MNTKEEIANTYEQTQLSKDIVNIAINPSRGPIISAKVRSNFTSNISYSTRPLLVLTPSRNKRESRFVCKHVEISDMRTEFFVITKVVWET